MHGEASKVGGTINSKVSRLEQRLCAGQQSKRNLGQFKV